ncbi:iron uptake transporter deferrochelatase/peroxidase subunit [Sporolactobacillus shoreicorticis]|uniref:Deferrochelatase n=1 Tax=Sporolactobacillus shoreicorticis TaxID=1923877 RepID=A0ABW5S7S8_9BACL|nr:iron uptake transporter deferrochelatase/peroxidase subunit [Sporolactobacillus shoreicorticis]MCO7125557.1 iron uptake transporter deferrochelatase/peroxidase subunit [Sporolactobacillus shoreicorticis]
MDHEELGTPQQKKGYSRREMLKMSALAGGGIALGASGLGAALELFGDKAATDPANESKIPFFATHQAGVTTAQQGYGYLAAFDIDPSIHDVAKIMALFITWTRLAATLIQGKREINSSNKELPPNDTNEARDLGAANLTITFGLGHSFFMKNGKDRFGLASQMPKQLTPMPRIAHETLDQSISNGDICVQICADIQQVAFHALRNLIKEALGTANIRWMETGFLNGPKGKTPRNLFGFKDGTANVTDPDDQNKVVWTSSDEPKWMRGGTYLGYRKIKMIIETWDRDSYSDQEQVIGRKKNSGAAFGRTHEHEPVIISKQPGDSHVGLAHQTGQKIYRRAYSYTNGIQPATGNLDAGLLFISYQNKPQESFIPMLRVLGKSDALNEYIDHVATGLFAIPAGIKKNEYFAQHLFE